MESMVLRLFSHKRSIIFVIGCFLYIRIRLGLVQRVVAIIFSPMEFVREITLTSEEESLSRLQQLTVQYNDVFQYVCRIITNYTNTWPRLYQEGMQSAIIYLSFLCKDGKVIPIPVKIEVKALRIEVEYFATEKLNDLLQSDH